MKVAVVILNYNGRKFLEEFLPNVITNCDPTLAEIVVADNASTDDSVTFMREHFPKIRLIENGSNGGFATGYNLALRQVGGAALDRACHRDDGCRPADSRLPA